MIDRSQLLVSGPSGAGKSEFIRQIKAGEIDDSIRSLLPVNCSSWPVVEANNMLKNGLSKTQLLAQSGDVTNGAIFHYDIALPFRMGLSDYAQDPFFETLKGDSELLIVFIKPDADRLLQQYKQRDNRHRSTKSRASQAWADWVRMPLKRASLRRRGLPTEAAQDLYQSPGFLDARYAQWKTFLDDISRRARTEVIAVRPTLNEQGAPSFVRLKQF
jgi:hypothetical protein